MLGTAMYKKKPNSKIKPLDHVLIKLGDRKILTYVTFIVKDQVYVSLKLPKTTTVEITHFKTSTGSLLKAMARLGGNLPSGKVVKAILEQATLHLGYGGTGKTTSLVRDIGPDDLAVCMTRMAKESIVNHCKTVGKHNIKVMTLEAANAWMPNFKNLYIDEGKMVDVMNIMHLLAKTTGKITIYSAPEQIGNVDMFDAAGIRHENNITSYVNPSNIVKHTASHRYGYPLVKYLQHIAPDLESKATHETTVKILELETTEVNSIANHLAADHIEVVIMPYSTPLGRIKQMCSNLSNLGHIKYYTTHTYQSQEADNVAVILMANEQGKWGLNGVKDYLMSALTRPRRHLTLIIVGWHIKGITDLNQLLEVNGSANYPSEALFNNELMATTMETMHLLTQEEVTTLNAMNITNSSASVEYCKIPGGTKLILTAPLNRVEVINRDGQLVGSGGMPGIKEMVLARSTETVYDAIGLQPTGFCHHRQGNVD